MRIPIKYLLLIIVVVLSGFYIAGGVRPRSEVKRLRNALTACQKETAYKDIVIDGLQYEVASQSAMALTMREARDAAIISKEEMRKLHIKELQSKTSLIARLETKLDSIIHTGTVVYDTVIVKEEISGVPYIRLPFDFEKKTTYTTLTGRFNREGVMSASVSTDVPLNVYIGLAKKSQDTQVSVTTPNPDVKVVYLNTVQIADRPEWKGWKWISDIGKVGIGFAIGRATK